MVRAPLPRLLNHDVGNIPGKGEVGVALIYAEYHFLESLLLYNRIHS
jgi:hypothetical protein